LERRWYPLNDLVLRVQSQLTGRDRVLLSWLYDHGVGTSFQLANALFPSLDFGQRRLRTLYRLDERIAALTVSRAALPGG